jgi:secreted trypsin-like serine protease
VRIIFKIPKPFKTDKNLIPASARIVGGSNAMPGQIPHQVALTFFNSGFNFAGGTLLSTRYVVTTANYLDIRANDSIGIIAGTVMLSPSTFAHRSELIIIHEGFNQARMENK